MPSAAEQLAAVLSKVARPGDFFASGMAELLAPRLEVEGIGPIALPLLPMQAEQLIAAAERAPYGRGPDTLVDIEVRRTWQIDAKRVRVEGKHWARFMEGILARVAEGLGLTDTISAELYKLLIYDRGSFFVSHRDTEKLTGMFATLVIVLPSISTGGALVLRHKERKVRLDLRCEDPSEAAFAAFYADCLHEVLPVSEGYRLTLVYNLVRRQRGAPPRPPDYEKEQARATAILKAWAAEKRRPDREGPEKLVYPLEHDYTPAEIGFETLKGVDATVAKVLAGAARQSGCDLHLALVSVEESGPAQYTSGFHGRHRWSEPEADEFEIVEISERSVTASQWRRPDGGPCALTEMPIEPEELSPPGAFDDLDPDEEHFEEATGNEGASFERTYRRAALILWPSDRTLAVIAHAGLRVALPHLADLVERWTAGGSSPGSPLWGEAHELTTHMLARWPSHRWQPWQDRSLGEEAQMLELLTRLGDQACIENLLARIMERGGFDKNEAGAIFAALRLFPPERTASWIERILAGTASSSLGACVDLLARSAAAETGNGRARLVGAAAALVEMLPGNPPQPAPAEGWRRPFRMDPVLVTDLFTALALVDESLALQAANHVLACRKTYGLDSVLVPAILKLTRSAETARSDAVGRLRTACLEHLRARVAQPLEPPKDWVRPSALNCDCPRCAELSRFLADPSRKLWQLKAAESDRSHVEATIRHCGCDLDVITERRGRPYSLLCTKNQASYERRVEQRKKDLADLKQLDRGRSTAA